MIFECEISRINPVTGDVELWCNYSDEWKENYTAGDLIHTYFNLARGDVYAWPADNMTESEVNAAFKAGQRSFLFVDGGREILVVTRLSTKEDYDREQQRSTAALQQRDKDASRYALLNEFIEEYQKNRGKGIYTFEDWISDLDYLLYQLEKMS